MNKINLKSMHDLAKESKLNKILSIIKIRSEKGENNTVDTFSEDVKDELIKLGFNVSFNTGFYDGDNSYLISW